MIIVGILFLVLLLSYRKKETFSTSKIVAKGNIEVNKKSRQLGQRSCYSHTKSYPDTPDHFLAVLLRLENQQEFVILPSNSSNEILIGHSILIDEITQYFQLFNKKIHFKTNYILTINHKKYECNIIPQKK